MKYLVILIMTCFGGCAATINAPRVSELNTQNIRKKCSPSNLFVTSNVGVPALVLYYRRCLHEDNLLVVTMPAQPDKHIEENNTRLFVLKYIKSISKDAEWNYKLIKKEYSIEEDMTDVVFFFTVFKANTLTF